VLLAPNANTLNSISLPNPICLNFQQQNSFKIKYLPHLKYENYEISFIKSNLAIIFQQHQIHLWIRITFLFMILLMFIKKWFSNQ